MPDVARNPHPPRRWPLAVLFAVTLGTAACGTGTPTPAGTPSPGASSSGDAAAAAAGVCDAIGALPDAAEAERRFTNEAHEALHALAADRRLSRTQSGALLQAMEKVETGFSAGADAAALGSELRSLHGAAAAALQAIGRPAPACP